jgi:hypothetical protein
MEGWDVPVQKWVGDGIWCTERKREDIDFSVGRRKTVEKTYRQAH